VGGRIGSYFIEKAKEEMRRWYINLPDINLAYFPEGSEYFTDYCDAVLWAQDYALENRKTILQATLAAMRSHLPPFAIVDSAVNCHHNYVSREHHLGTNLLVTRKGAVRARLGDLGIIPGSMGAKSYIVRGKGNGAAFHSCSHGAGRRMSRTEAKRRFTLEDHAKATEGVECKKDESVLDETPGAYKDIDLVMAAQADLIEVVATLKQVLCVKG
jgi:tRNA-splicing ligase RtcB